MGKNYFFPKQQLINEKKRGDTPLLKKYGTFPNVPYFAVNQNYIHPFSIPPWITSSTPANSPASNCPGADFLPAAP